MRQTTRVGADSRSRSAGRQWPRRTRRCRRRPPVAGDLVGDVVVGPHRGPRSPRPRPAAARRGRTGRGSRCSPGDAPPAAAVRQQRGCVPHLDDGAIGAGGIEGAAQAAGLRRGRRCGSARPRACPHGHARRSRPGPATRSAVGPVVRVPILPVGRLMDASLGRGPCYRLMRLSPAPGWLTSQHEGTAIICRGFVGADLLLPTCGSLVGLIEYYRCLSQPLLARCSTSHSPSAPFIQALYQRKHLRRR